MLDFALSAFVTLLLVVDPVGLAPAFLAATGGMSDTVKRTIALRAPLIAASILVVIAPGPAIMGMASGNTATSDACSEVALSASRASRCGRSPKIIW